MPLRGIREIESADAGIPNQVVPRRADLICLPACLRACLPACLCLSGSACQPCRAWGGGCGRITTLGRLITVVMLIAKKDTNKTALAAMELASFISAEILLSPLEQSIPCARSDHPQPKAQGPIILHTSDNGVGVSGDRTALNQGFRCSFCSHIYIYIYICIFTRDPCLIPRQDANMWQAVASPWCISNQLNLSCLLQGLTLRRGVDRET